MKKTLLFSVMLLVASAAFFGCKNNVENTPAEDDEKLRIFSENEVSIDTAYSDLSLLSDGNWVGTYENSYRRGSTETTNFQKAYFTVSNNGTKGTFTKIIQKENIKEPVGNATQAQLDQAKRDRESQGYTFKIDNDVIYISKKTIADKTELDSASSWGTWSFTSKAQFVSLKTNNNKTKYYGTGYSGGDSYTFYLMKK